MQVVVGKGEVLQLLDANAENGQDCLLGTSSWVDTGSSTWVFHYSYLVVCTMLMAKVRRSTFRI